MPDGEPKAVDHSPDGEELPPYAQVLDVLVSSWKLIAIVAVVATVAATVVLSVLGWRWPQWVKLGVVGVLAGAPYARWLARKARSWLWSPGYVVGVELAAEDTDTGAVYRWPSTVFRRSETTQGSLDWAHPTLFFARSIDDQGEPGDRGAELEGCWRGTLTDRELMWSLTKVAEARGQVLQDAARGFVLESTMWVTTFTAARTAVDELRDMIEDGTLPDRGEGIDKAIASSIADAGLEDLIDESRDDLGLPDEWGAEDGAFADPLGEYEYVQQAKQAAESARSNGDAPPDTDSVEVPDRELSRND